MNATVNDVGQELGKLIGAAELEMAPRAVPFCEGVATKFASDAGQALGRNVLEAGYRVLEFCKKANSAPANHLRLLIKESSAGDCGDHFQEVVDHVSRVFLLMEPMKKCAFSDALSGAGLAARGLGYGALGVGAGLGSLYWLLSRHANQDEADVESMQRQADYYHDLGRELEDSMRNKYRYDATRNTSKRKRY